MAYVVVEPCINCRYTDCAEACPVDDCFRIGANFLVIDPDTCIDCGACGPACPVEACLPEDDVPDKWKHYIQLNRDYASKWPGINVEIGAMPDHEKWKAVDEKFDQFDPTPGDPKG
jgi:ferredoxin